MNKMKKTVSVIVVAVLVGCATPLTLKTPQISDARAKQCAQEALGRMEKAKQGDQYEQYNVGKNLFNGCSADRVKNPKDALPWLVLSAKQGNMGAAAFLGGSYYGDYALLKHQSGADWKADELLANQYTTAALDLWERAGRQGFGDVELINLQIAVNDRGLIQRRIHDDKAAAEQSYCLSLLIAPNNIRAANDVAMNLREIGKTIAVCAK